MSKNTFTVAYPIIDTVQLLRTIDRNDHRRSLLLDLDLSQLLPPCRGPLLFIIDPYEVKRTQLSPGRTAAPTIRILPLIVMH